MSGTFDPYHRWLGIPAKHQPPNYYRLLGLELLEDDPEVIRDAVEQRMAHVRTYQLGQYAALSQRILNELATAKACLLDPVKKAAYDGLFRRQAQPPVRAILAEAPKPNRRIMGSIVVGGVLVLAIVAFGLFGRGRHAETLVAGSLPSEPPEEAMSAAALADLPPLQEVAKPWNSTLHGKLTAVRAARTRVLRGLQEKSWDSLLLAAQRPPDAVTIRPPSTLPGVAPSIQQPMDIPERFILTGRLSALRASDGKSVVYVQARQSVPAPPGGPSAVFTPLFGGRAGTPENAVAPFAAVEFEGEGLALAMSDYAAGDRIRVAVRRLTNKKLEASPIAMSGQTARPGATTLLAIPGIAEELRSVCFAPETALSVDPSDSVPCWCFHGEGLEKAGQTETWIDAKLGRAGGGVEDAIRRSPGFLLRTGRGAKGTSGRLTAEWEGMAPTGQEVVVYLTIPRTVEGTIRCAVRFGPAVHREDFRGYQRGAVVELAATIDDPLRDMSPSANANRPALVTTTGTVGGMPALQTAWTFLRLNCSQMCIQGQPTTSVSTGGRRRTSRPSTAN